MKFDKDSDSFVLGPLDQYRLGYGANDGNLQQGVIAEPVAHADMFGEIAR